MYRTGWNVDAEEARATALSSVKSENVNFEDAVPFEVNRAVLRAQQHQRMYEILYAKYKTDEKKTIDEFIEEKTDKIIENITVIAEENDNIGLEVFGAVCEDNNVTDDELINEGVVFGMPETEPEEAEVAQKDDVTIETEPVNVETNAELDSEILEALDVKKKINPRKKSVDRKGKKKSKK
jgi:hypothetical protein